MTSILRMAQAFGKPVVPDVKIKRARSFVVALAGAGREAGGGIVQILMVVSDKFVLGVMYEKDVRLMEKWRKGCLTNGERSGVEITV
jgi:hypothetical protein